MKNSKILFSVAVLLFAEIPVVFSAQVPRLLVIAFNDTVSKPWKWKENGKYTGPFLDVMREVAKRSGVMVEMRPLPWKRVLRDLETGHIDGFFGGYKTPEREELAEFLDVPMGWATLAVFVRKREAFPFEKIEDLYGKKIAIVRGYTTGEKFDRAVEEKKILVNEVGDYRQMIKMLGAGRVEAIAGAAETMQANFVDMGLADRFTMLPHPITDPKPIYICISKKSNLANREEIVAKMNQAIKSMKRENVFAEIAQRYGYDRCMVFGCRANGAVKER
ncbi:hypothetical protein DESC_260127 [Desulfosarcina cetonica]|uniref:substrate-binding periplasmic protein n=1 Tax=Desulfosarcina cetonica TaxID=90730 RepID=UPI0006D1F2A1|nr:transporter substrate-binding domain-containing protein [Desulfosarcina cetonica]VTR64849.1 hypothetical protein DESC_260127 [Desulfosarcina cetonica]